jgi:hypothetical protein
MEARHARHVRRSFWRQWRGHFVGEGLWRGACLVTPLFVLDVPMASLFAVRTKAIATRHARLSLRRRLAAAIQVRPPATRGSVLTEPVQLQRWHLRAAARARLKLLGQRVWAASRKTYARAR